MNEPKKWLDEPGDVPEELSALLVRAHKAPPSMGPAAKAAAAGAVAKIGASGLVLSGAAKSVIAVVFAGTIGTTTYVATRETHDSSRRTTPSTSVSATNAADVASSRTPAPPSAPAVLEEPIAPAYVEPSRVVESTPQLRAAHTLRTVVPAIAEPNAPSDQALGAEAAAVEVPRPHVAPIVEEARVLEGARRLLETDPARALSLIDEHSRRFPSGALGEERELLAVDALLRAGRSDAAEARARAALRAHPNGVHAARIRSLFENRQAP